MNETTPLLQSTSDSGVEKFQCKWLHSVKYRLPTITEKGAIVAIVWNTLMSIALCCIAFSHSYIASDIIMLTFPIAGYVADTWVGRFRMLQASMTVSLVAAFLGVGLRTVELWTTSSVVSVLLDIHFVIGALGMALFASCFIPFTVDQLVGASGEELSFAIYWLFWGVSTGLIVGTCCCW